jgi:hypothetical protein
MPRYSSLFYFILFYLLLCTPIISTYYKNLTHVFVYFVKSVITAKSIREILPSPLYNVKQLKLKACSIPTRQIHELVDALLWICPLLEVLFIEWRYQETIDSISFKVLHIYIYIFSV